MSNVATQPQTPERTDFLPGYRPLERLGSGGYGEVWKAEAPGGLVKAVKLLYGFSHEQRAADELKSLARVKEVRHPFLLSLERIETIDNRLFIVTELADQSLKDHFNDCLGRGKNGIPRLELLNYLRDAADALDFMSEVHGLQHLDIKPENLLLVAGHIKVADFGLVKDVGRQTVSLVGGMTPIYAAPEVFRGRPSRYSDQYSLAVVFQQMLTATLPFDGASAAELTLQHLNEDPDLTALPAGDRPTIARALSKDPDHRFASCRTMIDALIQRANAPCAIDDDRLPASVARGHAAASGVSLTLDRSQYIANVNPHGDTAPNNDVTLKFEDLEPVRAENRPAPQVDPETFQVSPTLLVGIGGLAGAVLRHVKRRLSQRFGDAAAIPAVATLLVDTDASELLAATHGRAIGRLTTQETLPVPLRRPQEYRSRKGQPFRWLSRRWLYNVPRSLKTEGLRPLGRLAFVDHAAAIRARLLQALDDVLAPQSIEQSRSSTGLPFDGSQLRVYLVASICGGTGSGMALDLAYMLEGLIDVRDVQCEGITGLMLLGGSSRPRARELAAVNAFAWLTEYNHFNRPGAAYPGDSSCGLEPRDIDERAFHSTYIIEVGDGSRAERIDQRTDGVAEYICLDAFSPVQSFLEACRADGPPDDGKASRERAPLCTFGVAIRDVTRNSAVDRVSRELAQKAVASWLGRSREASTAESCDEDSSDTRHGLAGADEARPASRSDEICLEQSRKLHLHPDGLVALAAKLVEVELGASPKAFYQRLVLELRGSRPEIPLSAVVQAVDRMFAGHANQAGQSTDEAVVLRKPLEAIVKPLLEKMDAHLTNWFIGTLDDPELRLAGGLDAATWFKTHLRTVAKTLSARSTRIGQEIGRRRTALSVPPERGTTSEEAAFGHLQLHLQCAATGAALTIARSLANVATGAHDRLVTAGGSIRELAERLNRSDEPIPPAAEEPDDAGTADETRRRLAEMLTARESEWIAAVNRRVQESLAACGGLYHGLCTERARQEELAALVEEAARQCVCTAASDTNLLDRLLGSGPTARERLDALLKSADGDCLRFGGSVCHVLASPHNAPLEDFRNHTSALDDAGVALVKHPENRLVACAEVQHVSLAHVATSVIHNRRDYASFAQRVLSRKDVQWSNLMPAAVEAASEYEIQTVVI